MRKMIAAALLGAAFVPGQAEAVTLVGSAVFDVTYLRSAERYIDPPILVYSGRSAISFSGNDSGLLNLNSSGPFWQQCTQCMSYTIAGNKLTMSLLSQYAPAYGLFTMSFTFADDLQGNISNIGTTAMVSGSLSAYAGSGNNWASFNGPAVSLAVSTPEPATWAMMIGGFGLVGAALRRPRYRVALT